MFKQEVMDLRADIRLLRHENGLLEKKLSRKIQEEQELLSYIGKPAQKSEECSHAEAISASVITGMLQRITIQQDAAPRMPPVSLPALESPFSSQDTEDDGEPKHDAKGTKSADQHTTVGMNPWCFSEAPYHDVYCGRRGDIVSELN
ncbi:hypothetical protein MTO96_041122 [Rhipicephalus appendiculatus]